MKLILDPDLGADLVIEVSESDLANVQTLACVAAEAEPGDFVYAPAADTTPELEPRTMRPERVEWWTDMCRPPKKPVKLDRPERLDGLRAALRERGLTLLACSAFFYRVIEPRTQRTPSRLARCQP